MSFHYVYLSVVKRPRVEDWEDEDLHWWMTQIRTLVRMIHSVSHSGRIISNSRSPDHKVNTITWSVLLKTLFLLFWCYLIPVEYSFCQTMWYRLRGKLINDLTELKQGSFMCLETYMAYQWQGRHLRQTAGTYLRVAAWRVFRQPVWIQLPRLIFLAV